MAQDALGVALQIAEGQKAAYFITGLGAGPDYAKVRLLLAPVALTYLTPKSALVAQEATFNGYTAGGQNITAVPVAQPLQTTWRVVFQRLSWTATDALAPNNIYGAWLEDVAGNVLSAVMFPAPVQMALAGQIIFVTAGVNFQGPDDWVQE